MKDPRGELRVYLADRPVFNTHCHHLPDEAFSRFDLDVLLKNSYGSWSRTALDPKIDGRCAFLEQARHESFFVWLQRSLQEIYQIKESLTAANWEQYSDLIRTAHADRQTHLDLLRLKCGYEKILLDAYWDPGGDNGHPDVFTPVYRINKYLFGYNPDAKDHNGHNPLQGRAIKDIDEYIWFVREEIAAAKEKGCVALKSALAYDRGLDFLPAAKETAQRAFTSDAGAEEIKAFQDYVFFAICEIAAELDLPLQCHTGTGRLSKTNAMWLQETIAHHPETKYVLFHGGYPWVEDVIGLVWKYANVYPDLCWLPLLSASMAARTLTALIEAGAANRICWGCDTWTAEESYGALLAIRHVLAKALGDMVGEGYLAMGEAEGIADGILAGNAGRLYGIDKIRPR